MPEMKEEIRCIMRTKLGTTVCIPLEKLNKFPSFQRELDNVLNPQKDNSYRIKNRLK